MPRQPVVATRAQLPDSAFAPLVEPESLSGALASFALWANSTTSRRDLMQRSDFPLREDLPAFLALNQLIYRGASRPTDLAAALEVSTSHISKIIGRLEDASLVHRAPAPKDDRAVVVGLSTEGRAVAKRIVHTISVSFAAVFETWSPHDRDELVRLVIKLAHGVDEANAHSLSQSSGYSWSPEAP